MRRVKSAISGVLAVLLLVQSTGCTSWQAVTQPVPEAIAQHSNRSMQVLLEDGRTIIADSVVAGETLLEIYQGKQGGTIPLAQVTTIKIRRFSVGKTIGLVLGVVAVGAVGVLFGAAIACSEPHSCGGL